MSTPATLNTPPINHASRKTGLELESTSKERFRTVDLTSTDFEIPRNLPEEKACRECLYWLSPEFPSPMEDSERKKEWLAAVAAEMGSVGKVAYLEGRPVAWVHYSLPKYLRKDAYAPHTPDPQALFICCLVVSEDYRGKGAGEKLLKSVIMEAEKRGIPAVETVARRGSSNNPSGPIGLYEKTGFRVKQEHPDFPLMRYTLHEPRAS